MQADVPGGIAAEPFVSCICFYSSPRSFRYNAPGLARFALYPLICAVLVLGGLLVLRSSCFAVCLTLSMHSMISGLSNWQSLPAAESDRCFQMLYS